jgi:DNA-binding NtrC family response regulator
MTNGRILIVDDDSLIRNSLYEVLRLEDYDVGLSVDGFAAMEELQASAYDIVITDIKMPKLDGMGLLKRIKENFPKTEVVIMTSYGSVENAVAAMKYGAADYITKPIIDDEIKICIRRILKNMRLEAENKQLRKELQNKQGSFKNIIGEDPQMQKIFTMIDMISNTSATVLIQGDSGTGKGIIAQAIHANDEKRRDKPFIEVSCGALPETLLESELFGHVKGAFTSAIKDRVGRFELAHGGTIFLDEIDTITPLLQVKLLRVLQEREFESVGDEKTKKVDIRIIAATNQDLQECIQKNTFREDLFYRLNVINIKVPPLKSRKTDIPYLVDHFLGVFSERFNKKIRSCDRAVHDKFFMYAWPGNIRELENVIERGVVLAQSDTITIHDIPEHIAQFDVAEAAYAGHNGFSSLKESLKEPERKIITPALEFTNWNRKKTATLLDINRTTLYNKMKEYNLLDTVTSE